MRITSVFLLLTPLVLLSGAIAQEVPPPSGQVPGTAVHEVPTQTGRTIASKQPSSVGPPAEVMRKLPIIVDDVGFYMRHGHMQLKYIVVNPNNPDHAIVGTYNGYSYVTEDGGLTWDEYPLVVEQRNFFQSPGLLLYAGRVRDPVVGSLNYNLGAYSVGGAGPSAAAPSLSGGGVTPSVSGSITGQEGYFNLGLGISNRAPRLSILMQARGRPTPAVNLKRLIVDRAIRPGKTHTAAFDPEDSRIVLQGMTTGLYQSRDAGHTWFRIYLGANLLEKAIQTMRFDPRNNKHIYFGTEDGLVETFDGGETYRMNTNCPAKLSLNSFIGKNPDDYYLFTQEGMWRTPDSGRTWELGYFTTWPRGNFVSFGLEDPFTPNIGILATGDGLWTTNEMQMSTPSSWTRMAPNVFGMTSTGPMYACNRHKGHIYVMAKIVLPTTPGVNEPTPNDSALWETWDGGQNWRKIYAGNTYGTIEWFNMDPSNNDELWVVWTRGVVRLRRPLQPPKAPSPELVDRIVDELLGDMPPAHDVVNAVFRRGGLDPTNLGVMRQKVRTASLWPVVSFSVQQTLSGYRTFLDDIQFPSGPRFLTGFDGTQTNWAVFARWNLMPLLFSTEYFPWANFRIQQLHAIARGFSYDQMTRAFSEIMRLRLREAINPPESLKVRIFDAIRTQELESLLEYYAGAPMNWQNKKGEAPWPPDRIQLSH